MSTQRPTDEELVHWHEYGTDLLDHDTRDAILGELIEARASVASLREMLGRVEAVRDGWMADDREHLITFGQHLPASVACLAEHITTAIEGGDV